MAGVFISYRQADSKAWAAFLRDELIDVFDHEQIFLDHDTLHAGSWREQIGNAVVECNVTLVVIGKHWLTATDEQHERRLDNPDDVHRQEIAQALARADMSVIPVLVDNAVMPDAERLPADIRSLSECQARRFSDNAAHREVDVRELTADIERAGGMRRRKDAPADAVRFLPFVLDESTARASFAAWAGGLKLAPRGLAQVAKIINLTPAWVPLWLASASVAVAWRGKQGTTRFVTEATNGPDGKPSSKSVSRTEYTDRSGEFNERFESIVIDAGAAMDGSVPTLLDEASARRAQSANSLPNGNTATKAARVDRASAEAELRVVADRRARARVLHKMGGTQCEITKFDLRLDDVALVKVHCPVFEGRYTYAGVEYAFSVNADSGEVDGGSPLSKGKLGLIAAAVVSVVVVAVVAYLGLR
jgi:TIR domain